MPRLKMLVACIGFAFFVTSHAAEVVTERPAIGGGLEVEYHQSVLPLLKVYCGDCHSGDSPEAGIDFDQLNISRSATTERNLWKKILVQLENRIMPPQDAAQPSDDERNRLVEWIQNQALTVPCDGPQFAGRVTLRRLNREEYNRTIHDLIGIDARPADDFPSDDVGYGFDNIGDVLSLPPVLLERYLDAAESVIARAIIVAEPEFAPKQQHSGQFFASQAELRHMVEAPVRADYLVRIQAFGDQAGPDVARMSLSIEDNKVETFDVSAVREHPGIYEKTVPLEKGMHSISIEFVNDYYQPDHPDPKLRGDRNLAVVSVEFIGPIGTLPNDLPDSHRRLIPEQPSLHGDVPTALLAVRANLQRLLPRAFRRPVSELEIDRFVRIAQRVLEDHASFERTMQVAIQAVLVSPHFLFRPERDPELDGLEQRQLNDFELASRLSYFLWSSMPDDELFQAASTGQLRNPDKLRQQVQRMLLDSRSDALVTNFASQWLQLRKLQTVSVDQKSFSEFTPELRESMTKETELLFSSIIREGRSIRDLLGANYTHVDEGLARLYGMNEIQGPEFRRVSIADNRRQGILGHAGILTLTSNPTRTSPVKRGKWILENLLGAPPPPAPPNVPELETSDGNIERPATLREQVELHRSQASCAACHQMMDPLGFGLENFDAIGRWRDQENGQAIDSKGELPDGRVFQGPIEMRSMLLERMAEFRRCLASKLLTYALGRGLEYFDECTLNEICSHTEQQDDRLTALIEEIALSHPFRWQARSAMPSNDTEAP